MKKVTFEEFINTKSIVYRVIPVVGFFLILLMSVSGGFGFQSPEQTPYKEVLTILNIVTIAGFFYMIFFPHKIGLYGLFSFLYSIYWALLPDRFFFSFLNTILFLSILLTRGYFKRRVYRRILTVSIFYFLISFFQLRFGTKKFMEYLFMWFITWAIMFLSVYYILSVFYDYLRRICNMPLILDSFAGLTEKDVLMVCSIMKNEKYDSIARSLKVSERTIKRRCSKIFEFYGCSDKLDFMAKYSNHSVSYNGMEYLTATGEETEALKELSFRCQL